MHRTKPVMIAAILQFLWSAGLTIMTLPDLSKGITVESGGAQGYLVTVLAFTAGIIGIVSAYGCWMNMRAGKILAILANLVLVFLLSGAVYFASPAVKLAASVLLILPIVIIVLLLWRNSSMAHA
jgi:hypothetical protein